MWRMKINEEEEKRRSGRLEEERKGIRGGRLDLLYDRSIEGYLMSSRGQQQP